MSLPGAVSFLNSRWKIQEIYIPEGPESSRTIPNVRNNVSNLLTEAMELGQLNSEYLEKKEKGPWPRLKGTAPFWGLPSLAGKLAQAPSQLLD